MPQAAKFIHPKTGDLVAAGHGRSVWIAPIGALQKWTPKIRAEAVHLFEVPRQKAAPWWKTDRPTWFTAREVEPVQLWFHLKAAGPATLRLLGEKDSLQRTWTVAAKAGLNRLEWDLQVSQAALPGLPEGRRPFIRPGKYRLELEAAGQKLHQLVEVEAPKDLGD